MTVQQCNISKDYLGFLQACSRTFAKTLRFNYCHEIRHLYDISYTIDVLENNKIYELWQKTQVCTIKKPSLFDRLKLKLRRYNDKSKV